MLIALIKLIHTQPFASFEQLGEKLKVSSDMVEDMVADLSKRGYLKSYAECASACQNCSLSSACDPRAHPKIWSLTEKGMELAIKN